MGVGASIARYDFSAVLIARAPAFLHIFRARGDDYTSRQGFCWNFKLSDGIADGSVCPCIPLDEPMMYGFAFFLVPRLTDRDGKTSVHK